MKKGLLAFIFFSSAVVAGEPERDSVYLTLSSISYSEPAPIDQMINNLEGAPVDNGDFAFTHNQIEVGFKKGNWLLAYFHRYDYFLEFNSDTAELAYLDRNDLSIPTSRNFDVYLRANHIRSKGFAVGYEDDFFSDSLNASIRLNYLTSDEFTDGYLAGTVTTLSDGYQGDLILDYQYSEDTLLERPEEDVEGKGFSIDIELNWDISERWFVSVKGKDVFSELQWDDVTYTRAQATTDVISFDEEGRIDSIPLLSGIEGYRDHTQELPAQYRLLANYQLQENLYIEPGLFSYGGNHFYQIALNRQWENLLLSARYDFTARALGFSLHHKHLNFTILSDDMDYEKARSLSVQFGLRIPI